MNLETFKRIIGNTSLADEDLQVLLDRAVRKAINHYWWREDDIPSEAQIEIFVSRYEYEIYDLAQAMYESASREGLKQFSELGVTRVWENGGSKEVDDALNAIPVQTYVW